MTVTIDTRLPDTLTGTDIDRWRAVPVAIAVDLGRDIGQIDPAIRPLCAPGRQPRLFGRAVTAFCAPPDFGAVLHALERAGPGDVLMIAASGHAETAMIGGILGGYLRQRGAVGLVCDGAVRDVGELAAWTDFAVYSRSITPRGPTGAARGHVNGPVVIGGVLVRPGDLVIGDDDGLVVLSPEQVISKIADAEAKLALEADWIARLGSGEAVEAVFGLAPAQAGSQR